MTDSPTQGPSAEALAFAYGRFIGVDIDDATLAHPDLMSADIYQRVMSDAVALDAFAARAVAEERKPRNLTKAALIEERQAGWYEALRAMRSVIDGMLALEPAKEPANAQGVPKAEASDLERALEACMQQSGSEQIIKWQPHLIEAVAQAIADARHGERDKQHEADVKMLRDDEKLQDHLLAGYEGEDALDRLECLLTVTNFLAANKPVIGT